ncbi:MAG: T9SS type A sorting domain-containing protein, partial [Bacteroidales bacterium]|nr:T9SS type A sorting domain-containing protein [Bacteroidales bacterium]
YLTNNPNTFNGLYKSEYLYSFDEGIDLDKISPTYTYGPKYTEQSQNPDILVGNWAMYKRGELPDDSKVTKAFRYIRLGNKVLSFKGQPSPNIDVVVPVTFTENDRVDQDGYQSDMLDGWNLIPNPFVSAVDASQLKFDNVDHVVYLHDNVVDHPIAYVVESGESVGIIDLNKIGVDVTTYTQYIPAGQSFLVHTRAGGGSVTFPSAARSHGDANTKVKSGSNGGSSEFEKIVFNTTSNGMRYQSVVYFADDATEEVDSKYDAYLQESSTANALFFYSFGGDSKVPLAANALPSTIKDGGEIRLGYSTVTAGTYTLSLPALKLNNAKVYLVDTENNTTTELAEGFATKIDVAKGTNNSRFKLVFEVIPEPEPEPEPIITEPEVVEPVVVTPEPVVVEPVVIDDPEKPEVPNGPVTITITRPTEDPINNNENSEVSTSEVVTPNPDNLVTVEDPVMPIYVDPESPVTVEPYFPEVVDIEPVLPEVITDPVQAEIPSDINPVLPEIIPEITPDPIQIPEPIVDDNAEMPLPDPVQFVDNDDVFVTPFGDGDIEVDEDIKIYPVPSDGRVTVDFGSLIHETGSVQMTLITGSGRILTRKTVYDDSVYLDLTGRTGIYLIRLVTPSKTITKRIIIQ